MSIAYTKGLPYGIFMKQAMIDLIETSHLNKIERKWKKERHCDVNILHNQEGRPLSMEKLASLYLLGFLGITLALCIMLMENVMANYQKRGDRIDGGQESDATFKVMVEVNVRKFQNDPLYKKNMQETITASIFQEIENMQ